MTNEKVRANVVIGEVVNIDDGANSTMQSFTYEVKGKDGVPVECKVTHRQIRGHSSWIFNSGVWNWRADSISLMDAMLDDWIVRTGNGTY